MSEQYTTEQYRALSVDQQAAILAVARRLSAEPELVATMDSEDLSSTFNILRPCDGCVPPEECDGSDGLLGAIYNKFACLLNAAIELTGEDLAHHRFWPVIDAAHDGYTRCVVTDFDHTQPWCYFNESTKAWHYEFAALAEVADEVLRIKSAILDGYYRCQAVREIGLSDIYTDAPEYAERVEKIRAAIGGMEVTIVRQ